jgi:hypothetical protein
MKFIGSAAVVDRATIRLLAIKANAVADVEKSRLIAGHLSNTVHPIMVSFRASPDGVEYAFARYLQAISNSSESRKTSSFSFVLRFTNFIFTFGGTAKSTSR